MMVHVLVTGAGGFVGSHFVEYLQPIQKYKIHAVTRRSLETSVFAENQIDNINNETDWGKALEKVDVVVHLAAMVQEKPGTGGDTLKEFRNVNVEGTKNLAMQAAERGVKRFIFLSSSKVVAVESKNYEKKRINQKGSPEDPYSMSKLEAEKVLKEVAVNGDMQYVIIRPPLVYGRGVKGNFRKLIKMVGLPFPLPLGRISNRRSFVSVANLCDLIFSCLEHPAAAGCTFNVSDDNDLSTSDLLEGLANAAGKSLWLVPCPTRLLKFFFTCIGKKQLANRLFQSSQLDISFTTEVLGWRPVQSTEDGLKSCFKE